MSQSRARRMTMWSGLAYVALSLVAFIGFMRSGYPDSNDGARKIAAYFAAHRDATLVQQFLLGLSVIAVLCFISGLAYMMWSSEEARPLAIIAAVSGAAAAAVFLVGSALLTLLAYRPSVGDPGLMRAQLDGVYIAWNASGFLLGTFIAAVSLAAWRVHLMPSWVGELGIAVAALQVVGAASYASGDGAFSPQGWVPLVAAISVLVWVLGACYALWRPAEVATPAPSAPAPA